MIGVCSGVVGKTHKSGDVLTRLIAGEREVWCDLRTTATHCSAQSKKNMTFVFVIIVTVVFMPVIVIIVITTVNTNDINFIIYKYKCQMI